MAQEIKIIVGKGGKVVVDVEGVQGPGCSELTKNIEKALGQTVSDEKKAEFYQEQNVENQQSQGY